MPDRLTPLDASFLYLETPTTPMHVGSVMIFKASDRFDQAALIRHVQSRIAFVPRYRQRLRGVPGRLAAPVWVDDEHFDLSYHIRRSALPRPGTRHQLDELVARLQARPLDRHRPLWELVLVEGLDDDRFAVITKVHQALVDGVHAIDLGQVILDETVRPYRPPAQLWRPAAEPTSLELMVGALTDSIRRPQQVLDTFRAGFGDVRTAAGRLIGSVGGLAARNAAKPTPRSPLNPEISRHRRFCSVATDLADYRTIRNYLGGGARRQRSATRVIGPAEEPQRLAAAPPSPSPPSVNDVVLATLAGALRAWLLTRQEPVPPASVVRALVPLSVRAVGVGSATSQGAVGGDITMLLVDLPTGEPSPLVRLQQIAYQTHAHREAGRAIGARALAELAGFAPPTLHSLGARVAGRQSRRLFNLLVTNVPGPQLPLYLNGSAMLATYPVIPLARGQALSVGLTSYDGGVYYGLYADREAMPDLELLGQCLTESLAEMLEAVQ